jgi:hypothetical protein
MTGMMIAIPNEQWILFRQLTPVQLAQLLQSPFSSQVAKMRDDSRRRKLSVWKRI